ncbi:MAG TPA: tetratricopeptide repeat protein [Candidatus Acidoferrum sp.]|nr:tetratricopeptide repeat protein [Candidatus Acidoferrum sp.]
MNCARCKTPNPEGVRNCLNCGSEFESLDASATLEVPDSTSIQVGADFGPRYHILALLGTGGMGKVYKAHDKELDRTVAIKVMRADLMTEPIALQRFKQELLLASKISHPNILRIHDLGEFDGVKFISMAFVEGGDLNHLLKKEGRLPPARAIRIMEQLCGALDAAHAANVVHRDLKPQNILLDGDDHVYVSDFGLAKTLEANLTGMTRSGAVLGTPLYMAPEQFEGKSLDHRVDLYALGLILYEMLTGVLPFTGTSSYELMYQRIHQVPKKPEVLTPGIPHFLSRICLRCLEKDPARRYQSASEILSDVKTQRVSSGAKSVQLTLPIPSRRAWIATISAVLLVALLGLVVPKMRHLVVGRTSVSSLPGIPSLSEGKFVAVMPIRVLGDQASLSYVADGLVEAISAKLFQLRDIHTAALTDVQKIQGGHSLGETASQLGVNLVVSGTLQGSGEKLRIVVSLDDVAHGRRVWTEEFSGMQQDLLTLEDQIYSRLLDALSLKPTTEESARAAPHPTENIEAYDLYLKGRGAMRGQQDVKNIQVAIDYYEQALKKDPGFALAYAGVADASLIMYHEKKDSFWSQKALAAAQQAERLNDNLPEVHFSLGNVYTASGKPAQAVAELKRALELAPNSDDGYRGLGKAYLTLGQKELGLQAYQKAIEINPYYWVNYNYTGQAYFRLGDYGKALAAFQRMVELEPNNPFGYLNSGAVYLQQGKYEQCIPFFQKALQIQPHYMIYSNLGTAFFYLKRYPESVPMFEKAVEMNPNDALVMGNLADSYRWSGRKQEAIDTYDKAIALAYKELQVNPRAAATMGSLALYYAKKGDSVHALQFIQHALSIEPQNIELVYIQAVVYCLADRKVESLRVLREALQKGYSLEDAKTDPELSPLHGSPEFAKLESEFGKQKKSN